MKSIDYAMDAIDEVLVEAEEQEEEEEEDEEIGDGSVLFTPGTVVLDDMKLAASAAFDSSLLDDSKCEKSEFGTFRTVVEVVEDDEEASCQEKEDPSTVSMPYRKGSWYSNNSSTATPIISNVKSKPKDWTQKPPPSGKHKFVETNLVPVHDTKDIAADALARKRNSKRRCWIIKLTVTLLLATAVTLGGYCGATGMCSASRDTASNVSGSAGMVNETRLSVFVEYINSITLSGDTIDLEEETAEGAALRWLIHEDHFEYDVSGIQHDTNETSKFRLRQRYALALLLLQQNPVILDATKLDECTWSGVSSCSVIRQQNAVVGLNLSDSGLVGRVPPDVGFLSHLESFSASHNPSLAGTLPETIGKWTNMEQFELSSTSLTGSLPKSIGKAWASLKFLNLAENNFNGPLPQAKNLWPDIVEADFHDNMFSGTFPTAMEGWDRVMMARFDQNKLTGQVTLPGCGSSNEKPTRIVQVDCDEVECSCCTPKCDQVEDLYERLAGFG